MNTKIKSCQRSKKVFFLLFALMLYPATGFCLDNEAWNTGLSFQFYPPGARALGMGGAFVALADDATAAASNPAGLAQLNRTQLAIEGRYVSRDDTSDAFRWKSYSGFPFTGDYRQSSAVDDIADLSFGAVTSPLFNNAFTLSVFYDRPMNFSVEKIGGQTWDQIPGFFAVYPSSTEISIHEVGLSLGKSFADGKLMFGAGVGVQFFSLDAQLDRYTVAGGTASLYNRYTSDEEDAGVSFRAGILAKPFENLRLGGSLTIMPKFDYNVQVDDISNKVKFNYDTSFDVPDNFSLGAAYNILPNWVAIFEAKYLMYSQLEDNFVIATRYFGLSTNTPGEYNYAIDDALELHFGTEYVVTGFHDIPIAFRAGVYFEPAHDLRYTGSAPELRRMFDGGDDVWHYTFGTGAVFFKHYQVDVGADLTEESRNVALSMVYQF